MNIKEMNIFTFKDINSGYRELVKYIIKKPDFYEKVEFAGSGHGKYYNKRSRYHLRNVHVMFTDPESFAGYDVACPHRSRKMNDYLTKERALFDAGITCANQMGAASEIWKLIQNPDGTINANYGYMVYYLKDTPTGMSQWEWCKNRLDNNINTLQAYMHFNRPKDQNITNLDQPCTVFTQFTVEADHLNFHSFMRSNDIIYGTPYNIAYFQILQKRMLEYLNGNGHNLKFGYLHHNTVSLHLYEDKIDIAKKIVGI